VTDFNGIHVDKRRGRRKRNFESFLMTGDRMINLAKTPDNIDFQSRYYEQSMKKSASRALGSVFNSLKAMSAEDSQPGTPTGNPRDVISADLQSRISNSSIVSRSADLYNDQQLDKNSNFPSNSIEESFQKDGSLYQVQISSSTYTEEMIDNKVVASLNSTGVIANSQEETQNQTNDQSMDRPNSKTLKHTNSSTYYCEEESDIDSLHSYNPPNNIVDAPSARRLATRLYKMEGFRKSEVFFHLSKPDDFSRAVAEEYCKLFSFSNLTLDLALRRFLQKLYLTGDTQSKERVLLHFNRRFLECNPILQGETFQSPESVHTLTCAMVMLNTVLHNDSMKESNMSEDEFVQKIRSPESGQGFSEPLLRCIYHSIKSDPILLAKDDTGLDQVSYDLVQDNFTSAESLTGQKWIIDPFLYVSDPENSVDYKSGYVMRKSCFGANRKKTKFGRRSWKMFHVILRDLVLYCFKDEKAAQIQKSYENPRFAIEIHHSVAEVAQDYTKRQYVFRLITCDQSEYLFQTSDAKEMKIWVETINTVVGRYSSPPFPATSNKFSKFEKPVYPSSKSKLSIMEQLASHRVHVVQLNQEMLVHKNSSTSKESKLARPKSQFLEAEIARYSLYIKTLENILRQSNIQHS